MIPIHEQVRWTIAAFLSNRDRTLRDVIAVLREAGIPRAHHACTMLMLAYGRYVLDERGTHTSPMYTACEPNGTRVERSLLRDPFFAAARERARDGTRDELELIALLGGEVRSVMNAMREGNRPDELMLEPPLVDVDPEDARPVRALPDAADTAAGLLRRFRSALDLEVEVVPHELTADRAMLLLEVRARTAGCVVHDAIAAGGKSLVDAYAMALEHFERGTLPVLRATLGGDQRLDQVTWHTIDDFVVCSGPYLLDWGTEAKPDVRSYIDKLLARLEAARLPRALHWGHVYVALDAKGTVIAADMMLDDRAWAPGRELAHTYGWTAGGAHGYSVRLFFMMVPALSSRP